MGDFLFLQTDLFASNDAHVFSSECGIVLNEQCEMCNWDEKLKCDSEAQKNLILLDKTENSLIAHCTLHIVNCVCRLLCVNNCNLWVYSSKKGFEVYRLSLGNDAAGTGFLWRIR